MIRRSPPRRSGSLPARQKPIPRRRAGKRAGLARECDQLWREKVRTHWGHRLCWVCWKRPPVDAAHLISRRFRSTRWDVENGRPICRECHIYYTRHSHAWTLKLVASLGLVRYGELLGKSRQVWGGDLAAVLAELRAA